MASEEDDDEKIEKLIADLGGCYTGLCVVIISSVLLLIIAMCMALYTYLKQGCQVNDQIKNILAMYKQSSRDLDLRQTMTSAMEIINNKMEQLSRTSTKKSSGEKEGKEKEAKGKEGAVGPPYPSSPKVEGEEEEGEEEEGETGKSAVTQNPPSSSAPDKKRDFSGKPETNFGLSEQNPTQIAATEVVSAATVADPSVAPSIPVPQPPKKKKKKVAHPRNPQYMTVNQVLDDVMGPVQHDFVPGEFEAGSTQSSNSYEDSTKAKK